MTKLEDLKVGERVKIIAYEYHDEDSEEIARELIGKEGIITAISNTPYPLFVRVGGTSLVFKLDEIELIRAKEKVIFT